MPPRPSSPRTPSPLRALRALAALLLVGASSGCAPAPPAPAPLPPRAPRDRARVPESPAEVRSPPLAPMGELQKTSPAPIDVRDFGADGTGARSDAPAINRAIRAAAASGNRFVYLPPGLYVIRREPGQRIVDVPIRPEVDGLTLFGAPDGSSRVLLEADAFAILVNKGDASPPEPVRDLSLRDLTFEVAGGFGRSDAAVVQINHAPGFHGADLRIHADARAQHARGLKMDGLATSQGTSGLLERILIDGTSKTALYIASGTHHLTVRNCETRNAWSAPPVNAPPPGIGITDAHHITIINSRAHHNRGDGLFIATNGAPPVRIPGLPAPAYGAYYPRDQAHGPATGVTVLGGQFFSNGDAGGSGIKIASAYPEVPRDIVLSGVTVEDNHGPGILVEAGASIDIEGAQVRRNGAHGILVRDVVLAGQDLALSRTSGVRILAAHIRDNGRRVNVDVGAIEVRGRAEGVGLIGGVLEASDPASRQRFGVSLVEENGRGCRGFFTRGAPRIALPIPFGGAASGGRLGPLLVPASASFHCGP